MLLGNNSFVVFLLSFIVFRGKDQMVRMFTITVLLLLLLLLLFSSLYSYSCILLIIVIMCTILFPPKVNLVFELLLLTT